MGMNDSWGTGAAALVDAVSRRAGALLLSALLLCGAAAYAVTASAADARTASRAHASLTNTYVKEQGRLHFVSKNGGSAIVEQGYATGTFSAGLDIDLIIKVSKITGSFTANLKGGSISGYASAAPHVSGQWVTFKGSLTIKHGTGRYAGASGTASLYGSFNRVQLKLNVQVVGRLRL
jgi:hypothetical protein